MESQDMVYNPSCGPVLNSHCLTGLEGPVTKIAVAGLSTFESTPSGIRVQPFKAPASDNNPALESG
jgi:hypothetical protein